MITQDADTPGHSPIPCIVPSGQERRQHAAERARIDFAPFQPPMKPQPKDLAD